MSAAGRRGRGLCAGILLAGWLLPVAAAAENLAAGEVQQIIATAVAEANAHSAPATIAVVDRVGNVLGVFRMTGAPTRLRVTTGRGIVAGNGLEEIQDVFRDVVGPGLVVDLTDAPGTELSAIAKAVTGAYLSSGGNAFTTRTANQIIQEHFNPGEFMASSGPLFGVQFTQLPCSDLNVRFATSAGLAVPGFVDATAGPKRSPLGLSADPGGLPLYKNGEPVGGIGVESDGIYGIDLAITDYDFDLDEVIALAGQNGFQPPEDIRAQRIFVVGKSLRYTDVDHRVLRSNPAAPPPFATLDGALVAVTGYAAAAVIAGQAYGDPESGFAQDTTGIFNFVGRPVFVLQDATPANRFPPIASLVPLPGAGGLTATEVTTIIGNALNIAFSGRAQIRRPLPSHIQVTVSVVDTQGNILGIARTADGPIFGTDTSLQKARTAAFFSSPQAAAQLRAYDSSALLGGLGVVAGFNVLGERLAEFLNNVQSLLGGGALINGIAFSDRSGGNLSRPFLPDGIDGNGPGPFSKHFGVWSPFNTGLQLDSVVDNIALHLIFVETGATADTNARCTFYPVNDAGVITRVANGFQIFPGSVPIYRRGVLIGGVGVSGDGVDQDDMVAFLGLHRAGIVLASGVGNAPQGIRADNLAPNGVQLRYVNCPFKPFIGSRNQNVCVGK